MINTFMIRYDIQSKRGVTAAKHPLLVCEHALRFITTDYVNTIIVIGHQMHACGRVEYRLTFAMGIRANV